MLHVGALLEPREGSPPAALSAARSEGEKGEGDGGGVEQRVLDGVEEEAEEEEAAGGVAPRLAEVGGLA